MRPISSRGLGRAGFTLVEILVASAILVVLVVFLATLVGSATNVSSQATARLDAVRLTREILNLLGRDFSQVVTTPTSLGPSVPLQFWVNPPDAQLAKIYKNPSAVFWQSSIARDRSLGNIAIVGYFVQRPSPNRSQLRRVLIEPTDPTLYKMYEFPTTWFTAATLSAFVTTSGTASSLTVDRGWVADGVLGLWVRCLDANGGVITTSGSGTNLGYTFDSHLGFRTTGTNGFVYSSFNALPSSVDIGLVCVAPRDAERIQSLPVISATSPVNLETEMAAFVDAFNTNNPGVKTATSLTRSIRLYRNN